MTGSKEFSKRSGSIEGRCVELEIFFFFEKYREDANRKEKKRIIDGKCLPNDSFYIDTIRSIRQRFEDKWIKIPV